MAFSHWGDALMNKAIREWFDWRGWVVVLAAAVVLLALLAILWPDFRSFIAHPATAGWAAAIATAVASGVALWVSTSTMRAFRTQQRDREEIGLSMHAMLAPELGLLLVKLGQVPSCVERLAVANDFNLQFAQIELKALADSIQAPSAKAAYEQFHLLPNRKGRIVAQIVGLLPQWRDSVCVLAEISATNPAWSMLRRQSDGQTGTLAMMICDYFGENIDYDDYVDLHGCVQAAREDQAEVAKLMRK
jgi:hypothetical protein